MYSAFISYSHAVDGKLAPALQSAVCRFGCPWYRRSVIRIFRDETDLSISPGLWSSIEKALSESGHFVLLASPHAAVSKWVRRELEYWLAHRSPKTLLIVITEGTIAWNDEARDFDWQRTRALPDTLAKVFVEEPMYLDLRSVSRAEYLAQDNPKFRDAAAALASTLLGRPKNELIGEDIAIRRRARRTAWFAGFVLCALVILLAFSTWFALFQRDSLARSLQVVRGQKLAAEAQLVRNRSVNLLQTSALLTLEAIKLAPSEEAEAFLRETVAMLLPPVRSFRPPYSPVRPSDDAVRAVAFSPDGRYLLTVGDDPAARLWDVATGKEIRQFIPTGPLADVSSGYSATFIPGGSLLITQTPDGLTFWDAASGQQTKHLHTKTSLNSLAVSSDGRYLATGDWDGEVRVVELGSGREILRGKHDIIVNSVAFSPDAALLVSGSNDDTARVWELAKNHQVQRLPHTSGVLAVAFSPDGKLIATGGWEGVALVWEESTGRQVASFDHRSTIHSIAFSTDGKRLASAGEDATTRVWDLVTGVEVARATHENAVSSVVFSPDGKYIATASKRAAALWEARYGNEIVQLLHPDDIVAAITFSPDGRFVATAAGTAARIWEISSGREILRLQHDTDVEAVRFAADGKEVETATRPAPRGLNETCVHVWDASSGTLQRKMCQDLSAVAFSQDGSHVVLASGRDGVRVRDLISGTFSGSINGIVGADFQSVVTLSPLRSYVAVAPERGKTYVWDIASGKLLHQMSPGEGVNQLVFSADERLLAGGTDDGVHVWEVSSGREITSIALSAGVDAIEFASDGRHLAIGGGDQSVRVWKIPEAKEVARFEMGGKIGGVAFSHDMEFVAAASSDRTARIWRWRYANLIGDACAHLSRNLTLNEWRTYLGDEPYRPTCPGLLTEHDTEAQAATPEKR
jgi:WD40 repeat protein